MKDGTVLLIACLHFSRLWLAYRLLPIQLIARSGHRLLPIQLIACSELQMQGEERLGDEVTRIVVPGLERRVGVLLQENAELKGMLRHLLDSVGPLSDKVGSDIGPWMGQSVSFV